MKCIYDGTELTLRNPSRTKRAGVSVLRLVCQKCGEKFLCTDAPHSHPYQTHPNRLSEEDRTKVYSIRLSKIKIGHIRNGKAYLTISGNRLQLQYKS